MSTDVAIRVLVNLTWLVPGVVGGSEESTTDSLRALLEHHRDVEPILAVRPGFADAHPDLTAACRCEVMASGGTKVARVVGEQTWLPALTRRLRPEVTHHAGGVLPLAHPGPTVLTVHDLQPLDLPGNFSPPKRWYLRAMLGRSVRSAGVVCVPSEFTAGRVMDRLGVPRDRIVIVPWTVIGLGASGPDAEARDPHPEARSEPGADPGTRHRFVYPAITYRHKNHRVLLDAFAALLQRLPDAELVLPGGAGPDEAEVELRISADDLRGRVTRPGRLSTADMDRLYRQATAVVVPSRYEGFGLPALEAMARGVPVLVADAGSLPEVVGAGAGPATVVAPIDPVDPAAWTEAMLTVARLSAHQRASVAARQRAAAGRFTARRTADALAGAYSRAADRQIPSLR